MKSPLGRIEMRVPPHYQDRLANVVRQEKPNIVVETGLETGIGAEYILKALDDNGNGHLYSIDPVIHKVFADKPIVHPRFTFIQNLSHLVLGELRSKIGLFDLFIHDSDHSYQYQTLEYELAWQFVRPGGIIASDDVAWGIPPHHAWWDFLKRHDLGSNGNVIGNAQWIRRL